MKRIDEKIAFYLVLWSQPLEEPVIRLQLDHGSAHRPLKAYHNEN